MTKSTRLAFWFVFLGLAATMGGCAMNSSAPAASVRTDVPANAPIDPYTGFPSRTDLTPPSATQAP